MSTPDLPHDSPATEHPATDSLATAFRTPPGSPVAGGPLAPPGYEVIEEIGRGAMGVVYKARQADLNRLVALKMILSDGHASPEERLRFHTEAEAIAAVKHPGIVEVHELGTHNGLPFFALELCPGGSLAAKLARLPLPPREAAALVEQLGRAVQAAHAKGIVHRDLKPGNVLLDDAGTPYLTDFGLAKREAGLALTQTGAVVGTPSYMAPEQALGKKEVGPPADIYALGAILYECLTGRPPFLAATTVETLQAVVADEPVAPRALNAKVPRDLETIALKCLQKDAGRRYGTAAALADDLRRWLDGVPILARPAGRLERVWLWVRRNKAVAALSAGVVLSLVGGITASTLFALDARREAKAAQRRSRALETFARVEGARSVLADAELGRRGYALGRSKASLAPCLKAVDEIHTRLDELARLTADDPSQRRRIEALRPVVERQIERFRRTLAGNLPPSPREGMRLIPLADADFMATMALFDEMVRAEEALAFPVAKQQ